MLEVRDHLVVEALVAAADQHAPVQVLLIGRADHPAVPHVDVPDLLAVVGLGQVEARVDPGSPDPEREASALGLDRVFLLVVGHRRAHHGPHLAFAVDHRPEIVRVGGPQHLEFPGVGGIVHLRHEGTRGIQLRIRQRHRIHGIGDLQTGPVDLRLLGLGLLDRGRGPLVVERVLGRLTLGFLFRQLRCLLLRRCLSRRLRLLLDLLDGDGAGLIQLIHQGAGLADGNAALLASRGRGQNRRRRHESRRRLQDFVDHVLIPRCFTGVPPD